MAMQLRNLQLPEQEEENQTISLAKVINAQPLYRTPTQDLNSQMRKLTLDTQRRVQVSATTADQPTSKLSRAS